MYTKIKSVKNTFITNLKEVMCMTKQRETKKKKDEFKINYFFCESGKNIKVIIEEAFQNYQSAKNGI